MSFNLYKKQLDDICYGQVKFNMIRSYTHQLFSIAEPARLHGSAQMEIPLKSSAIRISLSPLIQPIPLTP